MYVRMLSLPHLHELTFPHASAGKPHFLLATLIIPGFACCKSRPPAGREAVRYGSVAVAFFTMTRRKLYGTESDQHTLYSLYVRMKDKQTVYYCSDAKYCM